MLEYFRFKEIHELYLKGDIEEARHQMSELQARYVNLCDENATLRAQIQGYEDILHLARSLVFDGIFYWLITGSVKQGPFCPVCYNRDGLLLRLTDDGVCRHCLTCGSRFSRSQAPLPIPSPHQLPAAILGVSGFAQGDEAQEPLVVGMNEGRGRKATVIPFARQGG